MALSTRLATADTRSRLFARNRREGRLSEIHRFDVGGRRGGPERIGGLADQTL